MDVETITTEHVKRLSALDPLLPAPAPWPETSDLLTAASGVARVSTSEVPPDSPAALWRPLREHRLDVRLADEDPGAALAGLLDRWEETLAAEAVPGAADTAAVLARPSRDWPGTEALLAHHFAPVRVLAARPRARHGSGPPAVPGVRIRHAGPGDLDTAVRLQLELRRYDAHFGVVALRDHAEPTIRESTRELLLRDATVPPLWIAELYGNPLGLLHIELPPDSDWVAGSVATERVGYLASLDIAETSRGTGVGTALAEHAHQVFEESGVDVVLLHHAPANPRSTPFWYAQGYRPLWTSWYRMPAR